MLIFNAPWAACAGAEGGCGEKNEPVTYTFKKHGKPKNNLSKNTTNSYRAVKRPKILANHLPKWWVTFQKTWKTKGALPKTESLPSKKHEKLEISSPDLRFAVQKTWKSMIVANVAGDKVRTNDYGLKGSVSQKQWLACRVKYRRHMVEMRIELTHLQYTASKQNLLAVGGMLRPYINPSYLARRNASSPGWCPGFEVL